MDNAQRVALNDAVRRLNAILRAIANSDKPPQLGIGTNYFDGQLVSVHVEDLETRDRVIGD